MTGTIFENCDFTVYAEGKVHEYTTEIVDCKFRDCSGKKYLISCMSYLSKEGEAVKIHRTSFDRCSAEEKVNLYVKDYGLFGREVRRKVGTWEN